MEMRYFCLLDGEAQKYFAFHHHPGQENLGDYHTKSFTAKDAQHARPFYVHENISPQILVRAIIPSTRRGCVETSRESYIGRNPPPKLRTHKPTSTTQVLQTVVA